MPDRPEGSRPRTVLPRRHVAVALAAWLIALPAARGDTGLVPLIDLGPGTHAGFEGGLYPGGLNVPPAAHARAALIQAQRIRPLDPDGVPDPNGWIGLISIGMSNTNQEFKVLERTADIDPWRHARVVIVNGAVGGQAAEIIANPAAPYWNIVDERIAVSGLTPHQVQAVWLKEANAQPATTLFPDHAVALKDDLAAIVRILKARFVNLGVCYLSSRIHGGWSTNPLRGEPLSYETGFSVKWLIADQIAGAPGLNFDPAAGPVTAPLLLWGPYLWADGSTPRSDGLTWLQADFEQDAVHPSPSGEGKVGALLADFLGTDPTANVWYAAREAETILAFDATADATVDAASPGTNFGAQPDLVTSGGALPSRALLLLDAHRAPSPPLRAKLGVRNDSSTHGTLHLSTDTSWQEFTVTFATAPTADGGPIGSIASWSRDGAIGVDITDPLAADADGLLTFIMTRPSTQPARHLSRESGEPPRLTAAIAVPPVLLEVTRDADTGAVRLRWTDAGTGIYSIRQADGPRPSDMHEGDQFTVEATEWIDPAPDDDRIVYYLVRPGGLLPAP